MKLIDFAARTIAPSGLGRRAVRVRRSWCGRRNVGTGGCAEVEGLGGAVRGRGKMDRWSIGVKLS